MTALRAARREELLDAADRIVRRDGPAASMATIAAEAGITKPILYRHFGDRAGLVAALGARFAAELMNELTASLARADDGGADPRTVLTETISAFVAFIENDPEMYRFVAQRLPAEQPGATEVIDDFVRQVSSQVSVVLGERMRAAGVDSGGAEPIAYGIVGLVHAAGDWWVERRSMPRGTLVDYLARLLWAGLEGYGLGAPAPSLTPTAAGRRPRAR